MTTENTHVWVTLRDRLGKECAHLRIPRAVPPLRVLQWGPRFYVRTSMDESYREADCLLVTLASQYPSTPEEKKRAHLEATAW